MPYESMIERNQQLADKRHHNEGSSSICLTKILQPLVCKEIPGAYGRLLDRRDETSAISRIRADIIRHLDRQCLSDVTHARRVLFLGESPDSRVPLESNKFRGRSLRVPRNRYRTVHRLDQGNAMRGHSVSRAHLWRSMARS